MEQQMIGYSKAPNGTLYLLGLGSESWLRSRRLHHGCTELVMRVATQEEIEFEAPYERDLFFAH